MAAAPLALLTDPVRHRLLSWLPGKSVALLEATSWGLRGDGPSQQVLWQLLLQEHFGGVLASASPTSQSQSQSQGYNEATQGGGGGNDEQGSGNSTQNSSTKGNNANSNTTNNSSSRSSRASSSIRRLPSTVGETGVVIWKRVYAEIVCAGFLRYSKTHDREVRRSVKLKAQTRRDLSICLSLRLECPATFVVFRLCADSSRRRSRSQNSWPMVGLMGVPADEEHSRVNPRSDVSEQRKIWSLCLLDNWLWCRQYFIRCTTLDPWHGEFGDPVEVGVFVKQGKIAFFRRHPFDETWSTTGVVWDAERQPAESRPPIARPLVIGSEDGSSEASVVSISNYPPFEPPLASEVLEGRWTCGIGFF